MKNKSLSFMVDCGTGIFLVLWMFFPAAQGYYPHSMASDLQNVLFHFVYLVPVIGVFKLVKLFISDKLGFIGDENSLISSLLSYLATIIMLFAAIYPVLRFAENINYYYRISEIVYISAGITLILNIYYIVLLLARLNHKNQTFRDYKKFKAIQKLNSLNGEKRISGIEFFFRIRTKLFFSFIGIIAVIIVVMSSQLLSNYRQTLVKAISDGANSQVDQTSASYRVNLGDDIAMFEYIKRQIELNASADFKYNNLSIYTSLKEKVLIDELSEKLPVFQAEYSTFFKEIRYPQMDPLPEDITHEYYNNVLKGDNNFSIQEKNSFKFISAILFKNRLLGFSIMTFNKEVIMKPYFKVRNMVIFLTVLFLYISIILIYVVGNYIVNPILFLRMNVRKISDILTLMIQGKTRITPSALEYIDSITSRDEIKYLSREIKDMVTVIRGIVPYISASTLQHADKGETTSTEKELAFLFTDIRGFTTMCEGMAPNEVVSVLNKYLDLETQIIINNNGDVDKFVGDEMMAFFQGPDKEKNACKAAMEIRHAMMEERERRQKEGLPIVDIGIGINSGPVVFGSVGARDRMDFTSIGDTVNLAARLEGANKAYASKTIVSENVYSMVKGQYLCRELDLIAVKGKTQPVTIYEILQEQSKAKDILFEIKILFEKGLEQYREKNWEEALKYFKENLEKYNDKPSQIFIERIKHFVVNPPEENWDGVFRMTVK